MKFKFDPDLEFQNKAREAVLRLFDGAESERTGFSLISQNGIIPNNLSLDKAALLENLKEVQQDSELHNGTPMPLTEELESYDFTVEMETGTGKTYVYLRTILDLYKEYGLRKFIIVVPSVAIREGILKMLKVTKDHFARLYGNLPYRFYEYDSGNLARVRQFASSNDLEIMVMTLDSFNKDSNIFNRRMDRMMGERPLDLVQDTNPILVLDEPQNMESEIAKEALSQLNPLFKLRYSASHRNYYNLIYRLTPVDAYNLGLVKKIEVASVVQDHDQNNAYIQCKSVKAKKTVISSKLKLFVKGKTGPVPKARTVQVGDDLHEITELDAYEGFVVENLDAGYGEITFANGVTVTEGEERGPDHEEIAKVQIAHTIEEHMRKAHKLRSKGIKVLSLFFIDEVANYTDNNGYIRRTFEEEFERLTNSGQPWSETYENVSVDEVQGSYFSEYKSERGMQSDTEAYDLIMKDKEQLLSQEEPTEFIFSHSALREGWDNPNIFQICTLNRTISTIKKRQEIGRGMRLAVNQDGERVFDEQVNRLTVVANESYREYVERLQSEYIEEVGDQQQPPEPKDARTRKTVELDKGFEMNEEFKELWERISQKTQFRVDIDVEQLIADSLEKVKEIEIQPIKIRKERGRVESIEDSGELETKLLGQQAIELDGNHNIPNVPSLIAEETNLTRETIRTILDEANNLEQVFDNPAEYIQRVSSSVNQAKRRLLVDGIRYLEVDDAYRMELFEDLEGYEDSLVPIEASIYDHAICDSDVEKSFAEALNEMDEVKLFIKLPAWFTVPTPLGEYNPDWAIVFQVQDEFGEEKEKLYFVRETKGSTDTDDLRVVENLKIECAKRHFDAIDVDYDVTNNAWSMRGELLEEEAVSGNK